jgi:site-specific recombinase
MTMTKDDLTLALQNLRDAKQPPLQALIALVDSIRPNQAGNRLLACARVNQFCNALEQDPELARALRQHFLALLNTRRLTTFFCDSGILPNTGFFTELWRRMVQHVLPPISDDSYLKDCIRLVFHRHSDHLWLDNLDPELKRRLFLAMRPQAHDPMLAELHTQMLDAADILAARIAAMGLEPELVRVYPRIEERGSPFLALAREVHQLSNDYREQGLPGQQPGVDEAHLVVLMDQCRDIMARVQRRAASIGTSLPLSYLLRRLTQSLRRLELIVLILQARAPAADPAAQAPDRTALWLELLDEAIPGEGRRQSVRVHLNRSTGLLAQRVTENASRTGEHYITSSREEYFAMWRAAMGAGLIVGFMALIKLYMGKLALAPLGYTLAYSLNYAGGFVLVHVLHFTIATKQPAMTAATIADAVSGIRASVRDLEKLATLVVDLLRSQLAAIVGNVAIAMPTAMAIAWLLNSSLGRPFIDADKAHHLLHDISPFESLALPHAAIAGVCLFLAGLVSGYYDNLAAYERMRERIEHAHWLRALLGAQRQSRFAAYAHDNLGALAGNVFFGFALGTMPTLGMLTGLPLDIRHVTFASANFGFALVALDFAVDGWTVLKSLAGIGLVGLVNLSVSFTLALWLALRARGAGFSQTRALFGILMQRWRSDRRQFFWPKP